MPNSNCLIVPASTKCFPARCTKLLAPPHIYISRLRAGLPRSAEGYLNDGFSFVISVYHQHRRCIVSALD